MSRTSRQRSLLLNVLLTTLLSIISSGLVWSAEDAVPESAAKLEFFERKIRPVLIEHCYECHSSDADEVQGNLLVDSREGLAEGGDSGPALVAGKADESLLLSAIRHESFEMPPEGKLPAQVIADFETWINEGAADPREAAAPLKQKRVIDLEAGRQFWSFRPLAEVSPPVVRTAAWPRTEIDRFLLQRLEEQGIEPNADADRRTLLRRLSYDLTGLPPSPAEVTAFVEDESPDAVRNVVERLLLSPHFGERWGRYWLDSARFAESTGGGRSMLYGNSWRYRDYVVDSFNADKPFDTFIVEQLAGDLLSSDDRDERADQLIATAFLALGPTNFEEQDKLQLEMDVIDEQIDTVGRVFLGMTLGCARCHDHKFDPIPTADYYALAGIFKSTHTLTHANVSNWVSLELPPDDEAQRQLNEHTAALAPLQERQAHLKARQAEIQAQLPVTTVDDDRAEFTGAWNDSTYTKGYVGKHYRYASHKADADSTAIFSVPVQPGRYDVQASYTVGDNRTLAARAIITALSGEHEVRFDQTAPPPLDGQFTSLGIFEFDQQARITLTTQDVKGVLVVDAVRLVAVSSKDLDEVAARAALAELSSLSEEMQTLDKQIQELEAKRPRPETVLAVQEAKQIGDTQICIRGNIKQLGDKASRGFLSVAAWEGQPLVPADASGRRQLAEWIASPQNPLTARVYVNRVWSRLFGQGLVRTVDNFGQPGETPSHPQLLDYLARRFMQDGWSTKKLVEEIVLSRAYQLSSDARPDLHKVDPENRLLARQNRRRLDGEALYDTLLKVSGELDLTVGGNTVRDGTKEEYGYRFDTGRRAMYLPVFRNQLHDLFAVFDFADPNQSVGRRTTSTLSTQALFLMNGNFIVDRSRATAASLTQHSDVSHERVEHLFELALGRPPTSSERELALSHVAPSGSISPEQSQQLWAELCQSVFGCVDFRYLK